MKGQVTLEHVVLVACFIAALLAMQIYIKRAISGRLRMSADSVSEPYDPKRTFTDYTQTTISDTTTFSWLERDRDIGGERTDVTTTMTVTNRDASKREGKERVGTLTGVELFE